MFDSKIGRNKISNIRVTRDAIFRTNESTHARQLSPRKIFQNGSY